MNEDDSPRIFTFEFLWKFTERDLELVARERRASEAPPRESVDREEAARRPA